MVRGLAAILILGVLGAAFILGHLAEANEPYFPISLQRQTFACEGWPDRIPVIYDRRSYNAPLRAAGERPIYGAAVGGSGPSAIYRFSWLRTFHQPIIVRLDSRPDGGMRLKAWRLSGKAGYDPGGVAARIDRDLSPEEVRRVRSAIAIALTPQTSPADCRFGTDGAEWVFEARTAGDYRFFRRWAPEPGPMRDLGLTYLSLTPWDLRPIY